LNEQADAAFEAGTAARETVDRYVRETVLLATMLFLVAIAQRFSFGAFGSQPSRSSRGSRWSANAGVVSLPRV
jgi:hypothetical protein